MGTIKEDLQLRTAYPLPGASPVELVETHISLVFRVGSDVYKVKKPVDLGFLDFRDCAKRKAACDAELRLNARLAPRVYLGVVPVRRRADGTHHLRADGEIVDWAVHMTRLSDDSRGDVLLGRGELSGATIDRVATRLAEFHEEANADELIASFGSAEAVEASVVENFSQTRQQIDAYLGPEEAAELENWQLSFVRGHAEIFERRAAHGCVRDGHGDLRLEHLYVGDGDELRFIDCIEFNDRFRYVDVASDVAFLSMDLARFGQVELAERLLAHYARETNDFDLYAVVDFYESYRAHVRAKISALMAGDPNLTYEARTRAHADARRYFLLALSADRPLVLKPKVIAIGGVIASGKSTIADQLGSWLGAPVVEADRTRKHLLHIDSTQAVHDAAWEGAYDPAFTEKVYAELLRRAAVVLSSGRPVVLDASFRSRKMRAEARALAASHGVPFVMVECAVDREVSRARLVDRARRRSVSDGRLAIFDEFCDAFEPMVELDPKEHLRLATSGSAAEALAALQRALE